MPDLPEVAILGALLAEAQAFANSQSLTIAMPNRPFTAPADKATVSGSTVYGKWLRATVLQADTDTLGVGSSDTNKHYGYLQIDTFYAQGAGELAPGRIASEAISYFARGSRFTRDDITVEIIRQPYRMAALKDDPWLMVPVRVPYCCFTDPA